MDTLSGKFNALVNGVITGFDRIVFNGIVRPIMHAAGMQSYLLARKVLNKEFKEYAIAQSQAIVESAENIARSQCGGEVSYIRSVNVRKEELARARQNENGVKEGLVGVWSCVESCNTFKSIFDKTQKHPSLSREQSKCKHLYFYFDDPVYGFMNVRLQTWLPYEIQICLNGREWLKRSLDAVDCGYLVSGNKFLHIDDYELAQKLLDTQSKADFGEILRGFLPAVFPRMAEILGPGLSYYWTFWQSEVARDYMFKDSGALSTLMNDFLLHALITGKGGRILQYFGSPVRTNGQPRHLTNPEIISRAKLWQDGVRVRHWQDKNSVKFYNEFNVLRFEMTMNDPTRFKVHRHAEGQDKAEPKRFMPMRKGVADTFARTEISKSIIDRFAGHMSAVEEKVRLGELLSLVSSPLTGKGGRVRALDVLGKDRELLQAISDPALGVGAITNRGLQKTLYGKEWARSMSGKQLSGRISRHLRLLREHGLIKKLPCQRKYMLTEKGRKITAGIDAALAASVNDLLHLAA
jgi:hypothetical protein